MNLGQETKEVENPRLKNFNLNSILTCNIYNTIFHAKMPIKKLWLDKKKIMGKKTRLHVGIESLLFFF